MNILYSANKGGTARQRPLTKEADFYGKGMLKLRQKLYKIKTKKDHFESTNQQKLKE